MPCTVLDELDVTYVVAPVSPWTDDAPIAVGTTTFHDQGLSTVGVIILTRFVMCRTGVLLKTIMIRIQLNLLLMWSIKL